MRKITTFLATCFLTINMANAQRTMSINNGSFENWTATPGYSIFSFQVFDDYITPTGWHTMSWSIDTTFTFFSQQIPIQTDIPLQKMYKDSTTAPVGNTAAVLETFQIGDIIVNSTVRSKLGDNDTVVMPTILSIGKLNTEPVMELLAMLPRLMSDPSALTMLDTLDFNNYSTGGMDLNGFNVVKLTGKYKYEPAEHSADMGGVLLIGTVNDPSTGKRKIIGGGFNTSLSHTHTYTDFEVGYISFANDPSIVPDKLEILVLSSGGGTVTKGSQLCIDGLELSDGSESIATASSEPNFSIYPNPSKGNVYLDVNGNESVNVRIFNQLGQTVAQRSNCTGKVVFNLPTAGLYVMEVSNSNFRSVKQVVVTK
ncbi:MAG: T9SS type A sorting domain-containing protein [Bacteroidales bacterium]|nr:T9SS type A sorting domain-containing protein [Bacteroidales bacterium]